MQDWKYIGAALLSGVFLATLMQVNGSLALTATPWGASLIAHVVGGVFASSWILMTCVFRKEKLFRQQKAPRWWMYWGGITGALLVAGAGVTINSPVGLSGTIALSLLGQMVFSAFCDQWGWFGLVIKKVGFMTIAQLFFVMSGSLVLVFLAGSGG